MRSNYVKVKMVVLDMEKGVQGRKIWCPRLSVSTNRISWKLPELEL